MDHPNERSLHLTPTPRIGGIGILAGLLAAVALIQPVRLLPFILGAFVLALISLLDDFRSLPVWQRLLVHLAVAVGCLLPDMRGASLVLAVLSTVWMTNLYNFMDGADGLAGGMSAIGFGALGLAAWLAGAPEMALLCAAIAAATLAFLRFNFPPARIFMGDTGSIPLGFLAAALSIHGVLHSYWPSLFPLLVFSPFIIDASVSLAKRGWRGERVWRAHREHYYQRLVRMGWSHRRLALSEYGLMLASAGAGLALLLRPGQRLPIAAIGLTAYLLILLVIDRRWRRAGYAH